MHTPAIFASKVAEIALNTTGLIPGLMRILLRSDAAWTRIPQLKKGWLKKRPTTIFASCDLDIYNHITSPISQFEERDHSMPTDLEKGAMESSKEIVSQWESSNQHQIYASAPKMSDTPGKVASPPTIVLTPSVPLQRSKYSIFPTHPSTLMRESGSTTFSMGYEDMEPPRPLFAYGHKRILSNQTSATVEIGLRLSHMDPAIHPDQLSPTSTDVPFTFQETPPAYSRNYSTDEGVTWPEQADGTREAIAILPTEPNEPRTSTQIWGLLSGLLVPGWFHRDSTSTCSEPQRQDRNIMKSLPPVPRNIGGSHPSTCGSYISSKLASSSGLDDSSEVPRKAR